MGRQLTLREALASGRLADFVRQAEARGVELSLVQISSGHWPCSSHSAA